MNERTVPSRASLASSASASESSEESAYIGTPTASRDHAEGIVAAGRETTHTRESSCESRRRSPRDQDVGNTVNVKTVCLSRKEPVFPSELRRVGISGAAADEAMLSTYRFHAQPVVREPRRRRRRVRREHTARRPGAEDAVRRTSRTEVDHRRRDQEGERSRRAGAGRSEAENSEGTSRSRRRHRAEQRRDSLQPVKSTQESACSGRAKIALDVADHENEDAEQDDDLHRVVD